MYVGVNLPQKLFELLEQEAQQTMVSRSDRPNLRPMTNMSFVSNACIKTPAQRNRSDLNPAWVVK